MHFPLAIGLSILALSPPAPVINPLPDSDNCRALRQALAAARTDFSALGGIPRKLPAKGLEGCSIKIGKSVSIFLCNWTFPAANEASAMIAAAELTACMTGAKWGMSATETAADEVSWNVAPHMTASVRSPPLTANRWSLYFRVVSKNN